jgi:hypothetical protein
MQSIENKGQVFQVGRKVFKAKGLTLFSSLDGKARRLGRAAFLLI